MRLNTEISNLKSGFTEPIIKENADLQKRVARWVQQCSTAALIWAGMRDVLGRLRLSCSFHEQCCVISVSVWYLFPCVALVCLKGQRMEPDWMADRPLPQSLFSP